MARYLRHSAGMLHSTTREISINPKSMHVSVPYKTPTRLAGKPKEPLPQRDSDGCRLRNLSHWVKTEYKTHPPYTSTPAPSKALSGTGKGVLAISPFMRHIIPQLCLARISSSFLTTGSARSKASRSS